MGCREGEGGRGGLAGDVVGGWWKGDWLSGDVIGDWSW